jgi:porin
MGTLKAEEVKGGPFQFSFHYKGELAGSFSGGLHPFRVYYGNVSMGIHFRTEKAGLWKGGEFLLQGPNVHGANPSATSVHDLQPISRIEARERTVLFQGWFRQTFSHFSVLLGQHDMNSSFAVNPYAGNLISTSFGIFPSKALHPLANALIGIVRLSIKN